MVLLLPSMASLALSKGISAMAALSEAAMAHLHWLAVLLLSLQLKYRPKKTPAYGTVDRLCLRVTLPWITPRLTKSKGNTEEAPRKPESQDVEKGKGLTDEDTCQGASEDRYPRSGHDRCHHVRGDLAKVLPVGALKHPGRDQAVENKRCNVVCTEHGSKSIF